MSGFFTKKETESKTVLPGKAQSCIACNLMKGCKSPRMQPWGNFKKRILIVTDTLNRADDAKGQPLTGERFQYLNRLLAKHGINLFDDCLTTPAAGCFSEEEITNIQLDICRKEKVKLIEEQKPRLILLLGQKALYSLVKARYPHDLKMTTFRGFRIPDRDYNAWLVPLESLDWVLEEKHQIDKIIFEKDLEQALQLPKELPTYVEPQIEIIEDLRVLDDISAGLVAFDYETTGLKPHREGHKIICASVADSENHVFVFSMPQERKAQLPFIRLLKNQNIGKMAHNMKFEHAWSFVRLGLQVQNWAWDSMQAAHILDNRPGVTGLKFQTYVNFGIVDYASEISPYLKAKNDDSANEINEIHKLLETPEKINKLLTYCALDSIYEYRLAMIQRELIYKPF